MLARVRMAHCMRRSWLVKGMLRMLVSFIGNWHVALCSWSISFLLSTTQDILAVIQQWNDLCTATLWHLNKEWSMNKGWSNIMLQPSLINKILSSFSFFHRQHVYGDQSFFLHFDLSKHHVTFIGQDPWSRRVPWWYYQQWIRFAWSKDDILLQHLIWMIHLEDPFDIKYTCYAITCLLRYSSWITLMVILTTCHSHSWSLMS